MNIKLKLLTVATLAIVLSTTGAVHADGFFSKLFGGDKKNGADFKSLLMHVPVDTAYLIANKESVPKKVMDDHMQRGKDMLALVSSSDGMQKAMASSEGPGKFFSALLEEYSALLSSDKISETGMSAETKSVIYGYEMMPVMRIGIADKDKMMAMIKRAEEKSSYKIEFSKCGEFDCFESTDPKGQMAMSAIFLNDHIAISAFSTDKKESLKKHLMGEADPKDSYSVANWESFLEENNYPGYGDGFINLKSAFNYAKPMIVQEMEGKMDNKTVDGCLAVAEDHLDNMTEIVFGTTNLAEKVIDYEVLFKTSSDVSTTLQTLANATNIPQRTDNAIFDFGVNINFSKMRDALTQYSNFLIKSGEDNKCSFIQANEIRKSMGGMAMVMNMGLSQFNSVYASVSDIQLDKRMQPEKVDAVVSLGSNDPAGLIAMAGMMVPPIMSLNIPADGSVVKLPDGLIPAKGGVKAPEIFLSRTEKAINIFIGNDKPALMENSSKTPEISFSSMDLGGYMKIITNIMDALPADAKNSAEMPDMEMLKKIGEAGGRMDSNTSADKRGLAIKYHIQY
ncbi:MAG: hypothetical protein V7749_01250 [Cocleimonas sp.]